MASETLKEYMSMMSDSVKLIYPNIDDTVLYEALKYSIKKVDTMHRISSILLRNLNFQCCEL